MLNFKTNALAVQKIKGKENCENEHWETASFMYNFVQKTNATSNFDGILYQLRHWIFHTVFTRRSVLKGTLRRDQEVIMIFVKSPISSHIVMP